MDPIDLIKHAQALLHSRKGAPKQVDLRRAVSAAYYAVFHAVLRAAADELVGSSQAARKSAAYAIIYRGYEHAQMKSACIDLSKPHMPPRLAAVFGTRQLPQLYRSTARVFVTLQEARHLADYAPTHRFYKSEAATAISQANFGVANILYGSGPIRKAFLLALLLRIR